MKSFHHSFYNHMCSSYTCTKTADEVIAKVIQAKGGMDKLKSHPNIENAGNYWIRRWWYQSPSICILFDKIFKQEFTFNGLTGYSIQARDTGWNFSQYHLMVWHLRKERLLKILSRDWMISTSRAILLITLPKVIQLNWWSLKMDGVDAIQLKLNVLPNKTVSIT